MLESSKSSQCLYTFTVALVWLISFIEVDLFSSTVQSRLPGLTESTSDVDRYISDMEQWVNLKFFMTSKQLPLHLLIFVPGYFLPWWKAVVTNLVNKIVSYDKLVNICTFCITVFSIANSWILIVYVLKGLLNYHTYGAVNFHISIVILELVTLLLFAHVLIVRVVKLFDEFFHYF